MRLARLLLLLTAVTTPMALAPPASAELEPTPSNPDWVDPRERAFPALQLPADRSVPKPATPFVYAIDERSVTLNWVDGTYDDLPYEYETLVDGRVIQRELPNNAQRYSGGSPFRTSGWLPFLEPGTSYEVGVRRVLPDGRRSATTSITITTPGERVSAVGRPDPPVLAGVRARATEALLDVEVSQDPEQPWEARTTGVDLRMPGREWRFGGAGADPLLVTGLTPSTTYTADIRTRDVGGDTSAWVPIVFTTPAVPADPPLPAPRVRVDVLTPKLGLFTWEPVIDHQGAVTQHYLALDGGERRTLGQYETPQQFELSALNRFDLTKRRTHTVEVWAVDKDGRSTPRTKVTFTLPESGTVTPTTPEPAPTTPDPATPEPTTPEPTTPEPATPQPTTPEPTTPGPTPTTSQTMNPSTPTSMPQTPAATTSPPPHAATDPVSETRAPVLVPQALSSTAPPLRIASLSARVNRNTRGTLVLGSLRLAAPPTGGPLTVKVAVRAKDCRWWSFGGDRFVGAGRKARAARRTTCVTPPSWKAVPITWSAANASFEVPLDAEAAPAPHALRLRVQRGRTVLAERVSAITD